MDSIEIEFEQIGDSINPIELGEYLFLFNSIYRALRFVDKDNVCQQLSIPDQAIATNYLTRLRRLNPYRFDQFCKQDQSDLKIITISNNSPMQWVIIAMGFYALTAVIFSGGKAKIDKSGIKVKLPPLGTGIKALKEALKSEVIVDTNYGVKGAIIKLNKDEFDLLMQQRQETASDGGFQRFIVGLQYRINRRNRNLELSSLDLDKIFKYSLNKSKGGWQSRFYKIFSGHFPDIKNSENLKDR